MQSVSKFSVGDRVYYHNRPDGFEGGWVVEIEFVNFTYHSSNPARQILLHIIFDDAEKLRVPEYDCVHDFSEYIPF
jgi:hypothetical protein